MHERLRHADALEAAVSGDGYDPDDVAAAAEHAAAQLVAAVQLFAPRRLWSALACDEALVWSWPLRAGPWRAGPLAGDERHRASLAGWLSGSVGIIPPSFALDPRYGYDSPDMVHGFVEGSRWVEPWSFAWPEDVSNDDALNALRATAVPEAVAVADARRRVIYHGPNVEARLRTVRAAHAAETADEREARIIGVARRYCDRPSLEMWGVPWVEPGNEPSDAERAFLMPSQWRPGALYLNAPVVAAACDTEPAREMALHLGESIIGQFSERWSPLAVAHVLAAARRVEQRMHGARMFTMPASKMSRVPFDVLARAETFASQRAEQLSSGVCRVRWDGRPSARAAEQLSFAFAMRHAPQIQVFRDILRELGTDGLRDYVILHRMADEQGRTGRLRWTWADHKRATAHEARVRNSTATDATSRAATMARIERLACAELHVEARDGDRSAWRVIGDAPLVSVVGGERNGGDIEGLYIILNPKLYAGAHRDADHKALPFTMLPEAVLCLPALPFALGVMLAFRWRYAADGGGTVEVTADELHTLMDDARAKAGNVTAADKTLRRALDALAGAFGDGCTAEDIGDDRWRVAPPYCWRDAVVHRALPPSPSVDVPALESGAVVPQQRPRTGAELRAWREARGLSQARAAKLLAVGIATVKRAEGAPDALLGQVFAGTSWWASETVEGKGRRIARSGT